ncbi:ATPase, P-type, K/Mg/Cd/Cu/Zn/Na/Ca/Na/H-transporter [Cordyceps militaris CM01]|uniref:ATPase, P-type, K/Mg/Cd/Cu/Zn/Na/Ca/Na/H-transporter n=1 Tax=Cordyceps militaris (strain CM01) TaxID=983644 RepID=G3JGD8_CORMM|nr:ATPase, P-type, K/Mg/Cd/Cu/Zn/Na/Ca/Na/H-transporter [Cordyceps militaris CM01]EGX93268.1 ATPase, P-type, K/Mg/Cd/Cu/Zn/Na/Ca/Na/H-transporter [Cordyceps militaris CM01]
MGSGCCAAVPAETSPAGPPEEDVCSDNCCTGSANATLDPVVDSGNDKDQDDAPDCCAGKTGPCCDTSCLDRLAMRACEGGPDACNGAVDGKACAEHSVSVFDRYNITLATLGCICRALIALGEETCCEVRDRHSGSGGGITKEHAAQNRLRLRGKGSAADGALRPTATPPPKPAACAASCCSPAVMPTAMVTTRKGKEKAAKTGGGCPAGGGPCCGQDKTVNKPSSCCSAPVAVKEGCGDGCCGKQPESGKVAADSCGEQMAKETVTCGNAREKSAVKMQGCADACSPPKSSAEACGNSCCEAPAVVKGCADSCCDESILAAKSPADACGNKLANKTAKTPIAACGDKPCCTASPSKKSYADDCSQKPPVVEESCGDACCSSFPTDQSRADAFCQDSPAEAESCADSCCENPVQAGDSCADSCCDVPLVVDAPDDDMAIEAIADIEDQGLGKEHVILSISGMTCTGCETKLSRTLASVAAVKDLKTSLVLSRAEFNIDLRHGSVAEVIKHLERTTEFKCERIQNNGFSLDLIIPGEPAKFIDQAWPDGVVEMVAVDKQTVRVTFDPKTVGARDLAEKSWGEPFELAPPRGDFSLEAGGKHVRHIGWMTLLSAILTIPVLVLAWAPLPKREVAYASASLALATIVQVVIGGPFYPKALKALIFSRVIEMDLLIVLSTSAAYVFSVVSFGYLVAGKPLSTGQFFETSTLLVTLIMVGRWVAALARQRAVESISLEALQVATAILVEDGAEREIDVRLFQYGDVFKVLPDTRIPTDGTVMAGSSETDESMLTGESKPVEKHPKSAVIAGSINGPGVLTVRLNRLPSENTINTIAAMVNEAKLSKPKLQNLADQVACYFVPVVVALTIATFVIWMAVGMAVRHQNGSEAAIQAITYAITVLIVSCPCAIGLAVPMVVVIASGVAANKGIIFKSADAIEVAYKTAHVVFDKTGTLTRGKLSVTKEQCLHGDKLPLLLGLVQNSRHPVSTAVAAHLKNNGVTACAVPEPKSLTGKGIETISHGQTLQAGNSRWLNLSDHALVQPMLANGYTVFCFSIDGGFVAAYGLEDELRPDAAATIQALQKRNISVHLVSGDDDGAVQSCASQLGIPTSNVASRSSPAEKGDYVKKLDSVIFCGDGTNDAVALAQATIGVHINQGADVAQSAADVVLMRPHLEGILAILNVSRMSVRRIWFNFAWSFVYNMFAVLLAAGAFVHARIPPEFAGLGELVSVLPVIAAAVLLRWASI